MPNKILLLFNKDHLWTRGCPFGVEQTQSKLDIAEAVGHKAFYKLTEDEHNAEHDNNCWFRIPFNVDDLKQAKGGTPSAIKPCIVIVDAALFWPDDHGRLPKLKELLLIFHDQTPRPYVAIVSTEREPPVTISEVNTFAGLYDHYFPLLRNDTNPWDALYNIIKFGEMEVRVRRIGELTSARSAKAGVTSQSQFDNARDIDISNDSPSSPSYNSDSNPLLLDGLTIRHVKIGAPPTSDDKPLCVNRPILIRNCTIESLQIDYCCFPNDLIIQNCHIAKGITIRHSCFESVCDFDDCDIGGDVTFMYNVFRYRLPWFRKLIFRWRFDFRRNQGPDLEPMGAVPTLMFNRCVFKARNRIDMPEQRARLTFRACSFAQGEYTEVEWSRFDHDDTGTLGPGEVIPAELGITNPKVADRFLDKIFDGTLEGTGNCGNANISQKELVDALTKRVRRFHIPNIVPKHAFNVDIYVRFTNCVMGGRIVLRENPVYGRGVRYRTAEGLVLIIEASTVSGIINARGCRLRAIDVSRTSFLGGGLVLENLRCHGLHRVARIWNGARRRHVPLSQDASRPVGSPPRTMGVGNTILRLFFLPADYCGLVLDEQIHEGIEKRRFASVIRWVAELGASEKQDPPVTRLAKHAVEQSGQEVATKINPKHRSKYLHMLYTSIAQQYEDLKYGFANTSNTDALEDVCHYKAMAYRCKARDAEICTANRIAAPILWLLVPILGWMIFLYRTSDVVESEEWITIAIRDVSAGWSLISTLIVIHSDSTRGAIRNFIELVFLRIIIGYGVYPRRILISAFICALFFAAIYFSAQHPCCQWLGTLADGKESLSSYGFTDAFYLSVVSFTTLGFGELHFTGVLRIVAAAESVAGVLLFASLTVALARQFLRR